VLHVQDGKKQSKLPVSLLSAHVYIHEQCVSCEHSVRMLCICCVLMHALCCTHIRTLLQVTVTADEHNHWYTFKPVLKLQPELHMGAVTAGPLPKDCRIGLIWFQGGAVPIRAYGVCSRN
jgi:hypothetical protein